MYAVENISHLRLRLKLSTLIAAQQLKDTSFQIFTENTLLVTMMEV